MEIKIKKVYDREGEHSFATDIFEGDYVSHERVYFDNKKDFIDKYDKKTKGLSGCAVGVPEDYWFNTDSKEAEKGYFIFIRYQLYDVKFIAVMNRTVFITNKGQTIDVI